MNHKMGLAALVGLGTVLAYSACSQPDYESSNQQQKEQDTHFSLGEMDCIVEDDIPVTITGRVIDEGKVDVHGVTKTSANFYMVVDQESRRLYTGLIEGLPLDPFDTGDCVKLTLDRIGYQGHFGYVNGTLISVGHQILQYEKRSFDTCSDVCWQQ